MNNDTTSIEKNIYEQLYINFINILSVIDKNNTIQTLNPTGASRINNSISNLMDYDDSKIDLMNLPINVQVKAGFQRNMNPAKVLLEMEEAISKSKLPKKEKNKVSVLIFIKQVGPGNKRKIEDELVYMWSNVFDYFRNEFPYLYSHKIAEYKKTKIAIGIPFYHFKQIILKFYKNEQTNI